MIILPTFHRKHNRHMSQLYSFLADTKKHIENMLRDQEHRIRRRSSPHKKPTADRDMFLLWASLLSIPLSGLFLLLCARCQTLNAPGFRLAFQSLFRDNPLSMAQLHPVVQPPLVPIPLSGLYCSIFSVARKAAKSQSVSLASEAGQDKLDPYNGISPLRDLICHLYDRLAHCDTHQRSVGPKRATSDPPPSREVAACARYLCEGRESEHEQ